MNANKLNLVVQFTAIDKLSNGLRNIIGLGRTGGQVLGKMKSEARAIDRELGKVRRELRDGIASGAPGLTALVQRERELATAAAQAATQIERQNRLLAIQARTDRMTARGAALRQQGMGNVYGGAAMAAPLILAAKSAGDFSSGMVDIQQKANLSDAATAQLANNITAAALAARQMPEDMRAAVDVLAGKGLDPLQAAQMVPSIGRLGTAFKVDLADGAAAGYAALNNLKVPLGEIPRMFDIMAASGNMGAFEVKDMARHFPALTASMQALGETGLKAGADLSAALQVAEKGTGDPDTAANNIKNLLTKMNAPSTIAAFKKNFGINLPAAMKKLTDSGMTSMEAIATLTQQATKGDLSKIGFAFQDMEAQGAVRSLIQNMDEYRKIRTAAMNAGGTVDKAFDQRVAKDATVNWRAFMATAATLAITLGTTLLPTLTEITGQLTAGVSAVASWAQAHPEAAGLIMKLVGGLAAMRIGLGALQFAFGGLLGPVGKVWGFFSKVDGVSKAGTTLLRFRSVSATVFKFVGRGGMLAARLFMKGVDIFNRAGFMLVQGIARVGVMLMANPIILGIMLLVAAVAVAGYFIYKHWDAIKGAFWSAVAGIGNAMSAAGAWISGAWSTIKGYFVAGMNWIVGLGQQMFRIGSNIIQAIARGILAAPGLVWNALKSVVMTGITGVKDLLGIKSPSRVFMGLGNYLTQGLALGVDRGADEPIQRMKRLAGQMTAAIAMGSAAVPAAAMSAGAGSGAAPAAIVRHYEIHIHQQPGQDAQDLARIIAEAIEQHENRKTATARSAYQDDD